MRMGERIAGTEQRAEVGELLGGGVGDIGRRRRERAPDGGAVEDLHLVGLGLLGERHVGAVQLSAAAPVSARVQRDDQIAGLARLAPRLSDMAHRERPESDALRA